MKNRPEQPERLHTIREVAEHVGISERTVRREIARGALETVRVGPALRLVRISGRAIRLYLAERQG